MIYDTIIESAYHFTLTQSSSNQSVEQILVFSRFSSNSSFSYSASESWGSGKKRDMTKQSTPIMIMITTMICITKKSWCVNFSKSINTSFSVSFSSRFRHKHIITAFSSLYFSDGEAKYS